MFRLQMMVLPPLCNLIPVSVVHFVIDQTCAFKKKKKEKKGNCALKCFCFQCLFSFPKQWLPLYVWVVLLFTTSLC